MTTLATRDQVPRVWAAPPRPSGQPAASAGLNPRDLVRIILRRKWMIMLTILATVGVGLALTLIWWMYFPSYEAEALLSVEPPPVTYYSQPGFSNMASKEIIERYKRSFAALVKHQDVLDAAGRNPKLARTQWFQNHRDKLAQELADAIDVSVLPETQFIRLSMRGFVLRESDRGELAEIVNALGEAFVDFASRPTVREREAVIKKMSDQRKQMEGEKTSFQERINGLGGGAEAAMQNRQTGNTILIQELTRERNMAEAKRDEADAAWEQFQKDNSSDQPEKSGFVQEMIDRDPTYRQMEYEKTQRENRLENLIRKLGPKHRDVEAMQNSLDTLKSQLADRRKDIAQQAYGQYSSGLQQAAARARKELEAVLERYNLAKNESRQLEADLNKVALWRQRVEDLDKSINRLEDEINSRQLINRPTQLGQAESVGPVSVTASATTPRERALPKWKVMVPVVIFAGLMLSFGLAFLVELTDTSVKGPSDMARRVNLPLLGMVPHGDDMDEEIENFHKALLAAPHSPAAEAFRQIRTNLLFSGPAETRRSILVTSPAPEDGRTSVVINLAISMAQAGRKVLIVDANFRQPAIGREFSQAPPAGLSSALVGQVNWREAVGQTDVPNLYAMAAGPRPPNPAELLGSEAMRQIVKEMAAEYDQVLLDGSPAMLVSDARVLSAAVDGVIMVVRAGITNYGMVQRSAEQLSRVGSHVVGCVLNDVRVTAGGYLRKNYETFYEYHQQSLPEA